MKNPRLSTSTIDRIPETEIETPENDGVYASTHFDYSNDLELIRRLIPTEYNNDTLLFVDLACGNGDLLEVLSEEYPAAAFLGVDKSSIMIENARQNLSHKKNISLLQDDIYNVLIDINTRDLFTSWSIKNPSHIFLTAHSVLHHINNPRRFIQFLDSMPSGHGYYITDLRRPYDEEELQDALIGFWKNFSHISLQQMFENSLRSAFTYNEIRDMYYPYYMPLSDVWEQKIVVGKPISQSMGRQVYNSHLFGLSQKYPEE